MATVNLIDLAWAAGFLEGEGCFYMNGKKPRVVVNQKQLEPLVRLQEMAGGKIYKPRTRDYYSLQIHRREEALGLMRSLYPYMSTRRREQIQKCLERF